MEFIKLFGHAVLGKFGSASILEYLDYYDALRHSCHLLNYYYEYDTIIEYYYLNMLLLLFQQILSYLPLALVPPPIIEGQLGYPTGCSVFQSSFPSFQVFPRVHGVVVLVNSSGLISGIRIRYRIFPKVSPSYQGIMSVV